ncbi:MAG: hypothetical protein WCT26_05220 [Candidatus Buchananbacteria bacterium]|jgi:hypothetical protein
MRPQILLFDDGQGRIMRLVNHSGKRIDIANTEILNNYFFELCDSSPLIFKMEIIIVKFDIMLHFSASAIMFLPEIARGLTFGWQSNDTTSVIVGIIGQASAGLQKINNVPHKRSPKMPTENNQNKLFSEPLPILDFDALINEIKDSDKPDQ